MYQIDTYVRYGANGVFRIQEIITKKCSPRERKRYYVLEGLFGVETKITTPIDNPNLRAILSPTEVTTLIAEMPTLSSMWIEDKRARGEAFKAMIASNDAASLVQVIKTIYLKKIEKEKEKKMLSDEDLNTMKEAEELLCEEISLTTGMEKDQVIPYILNHIQEVTNR